jgi:small subunit ribosomal protein S19
MSAKKRTHYRGRTLKELQTLSLDEVVEVLPARQRRSLNRPQYWDKNRKKLLSELRKAKEQMDKGKQVVVRTHIRDFVILPEFVGLTVEVYNGKEFVPVDLTLDRVGDYLAEYAHPRRLVKHSAPGIGATRSSMYVPLK